MYRLGQGDFCPTNVASFQRTALPGGASRLSRLRSGVHRPMAASVRRPPRTAAEPDFTLQQGHCAATGSGSSVTSLIGGTATAARCLRTEFQSKASKL